MGPMRLLVVAMVALAVTAASAGEPKEKVLVLLDTLDMKDSHSKFLQNLSPKDFDVKVASVDDKDVKLREWDDWLFDKLVILGGSNSEFLPTTALSLFLIYKPFNLIFPPSLSLSFLHYQQN